MSEQLAGLQAIVEDCDRWIKFIRGHNDDHPRRRPLDPANYIMARDLAKKVIHAVQHNQPVDPKWLESIDSISVGLEEFKRANDAREAKLKRKRKGGNSDGC